MKLLPGVMNAETEALYLENSESVASIRERLAGMRGKRVLLILPEDGALFRRKLDLILVQREAYRRAIQLAIVSRDPRVLGNANEANISCFPTFAASQRERWKRGRQKVFLPRHHKPDPFARPEELRSLASRISETGGPRSRFWRHFERLAVLVLLIAVVGAAVYIVAPSASVDVSLRQEPIFTELEITADISIDAPDFGLARVPAEQTQVLAEATSTMPTSGLRNLDDVTATGIVTFTNRAADAVNVPAFTLLSTSAGEPVLFQTVADVEVPAGIDRRAEAPVAALSRFGGNVGNVAAGMINAVVGPLDASVSVINLTPTAGGESRTVKIVAVDDRTQLLERARAQLLTIAYEEIGAGLSDTQIIVIDSLHIEDEHKDWTSFSAQVGEMADDLTVNMRATVSAVVLDEDLSRQVVTSRLRDRIPVGKALIADTIHYSRGPMNWHTARGQARFVARAEGHVVTQVDSSRLREQLAGKTVAEATAFLEATTELAGGASTTIDVFPTSLDRMPSLPIRISIDVRLPS